MQRPASVTVFGVLSILWAAYILLAMAASVVIRLTGFGGENPANEELMANAAYLVFLNVSSVVAVIAGIALLASGIGMFMLKPWARTTAIVYAVYGILNSLVGGIVYFAFIMPVMAKQAQVSGAGPLAGAGMIEGLFVCSGIAGLGVSLAYPILLLIFMFRGNVVAAFRTGGSGELTDRYERRY